MSDSHIEHRLAEGRDLVLALLEDGSWIEREDEPVVSAFLAYSWQEFWVDRPEATVNFFFHGFKHLFDELGRREDAQCVRTDLIVTGIHCLRDNIKNEK
jgi:hypothetical protein